MNAEDDLSRVGISLPKNLLDSFDKVLDVRGYSSRSEGVRDALRTYITYYQWMADVKGERKGIITLVYNHEQRGLVETITEIQHDHNSLIKTSLHSEVSGTRSLEVILVHGEGSGIKSFAEKLMSLKGVETVKITTIRLDV